MYDQAKRHLEFLATSPALPRDLSSSVAEYLTESAMLYADPMVRNRPDLAVPIFQQALGLYDKLGVANWFCLEQYRDVLKQLGRNSEADAPPSDRSRNLTGRNGTLQELIARGVLAPGFAGAVDGYSYEVQMESDGQYRILAKPTGSLGRYSFRTNNDKNGGGIRFASGPPGAPIGEVPPPVFYEQ